MGTRYFNTDINHTLLYVDANHLYGWAMMEPQSYGEFEIEDGSGLKAKHILRIKDGAEFAYFFEVDLYYSDDIKEKNN
jgi:hypothetical protein